MTAEEKLRHIGDVLRELALFVFEGEEEERIAREDRLKNFKVLRPDFPPKRKNEDSKRNIENCKAWTNKEIQQMPFIKDLKYRVTQDGIHQFRYRRDGYDVSFNSKNFEVAKKKAIDFIKSIKHSIRSEADAVRGYSVDYVARAWLELKKAHTSKTTWRIYVGIYENHIYPTFGKRSVKSILPIHLQPFFNDLFSRQERTCEDTKVILNGIFKYALANRMITSNPMQGVIVERHFRKTGTALTDEQLSRFKEIMLRSGTHGASYLIILYTGIRGAELESLRFDWENGTFTVKNAKLKKSQKANPNNLTRTVPIFPALYGLKDFIESNAGWNYSAGTVTCKFCNFWSENTVKDLRHTFISRARECGIDNELVNLWTGHLPGPNVTATVYTHFSLAFQKKQAQKLKPY